MKLNNEPSLVLIGNPLLFEKQKPIPVENIITEEMKHNLNILKNSQLSEQGIGIAAPQIGWNAKIFSMGIINETGNDRYSEAPEIPFQFWINPKITAVSPTTNWTWEGCLSVPGIRGWIERPSHIDVEGYNEKGELIKERLNDYRARVFQHEFDHLNGMLFPMRAHNVSMIIPFESMSFQSEWAKDWPTANAKKTSPGQLCSSR